MAGPPPAPAPLGGGTGPDPPAAGRPPPRQWRPGAPPARRPGPEIAATAPDLSAVAPCGYDGRMAADAIAALDRLPDWRALRAVRSRQVYPVDANSYWSRPGPRLVEGIEALQRILST